MSTTTITNTILTDYKFAKHKGKEYHVFSESITNPSDCVGDWLAINSEYLILTDSKTIQKLQKHKIQWNFNEENTIVSCVVTS